MDGRLAGVWEGEVGMYPTHFGIDPTNIPQGGVVQNCQNPSLGFPMCPIHLWPPLASVYYLMIHMFDAIALILKRLFTYYVTRWRGGGGAVNVDYC